MKQSAAEKMSVKKALILAGSAGLILAALLLPNPAPFERSGVLITLTPQGQGALGLLGAAILLWVSEIIPFSVTSLLVMILIPVLGLASFDQAVKTGFGNPIILFFIGVLTLTSAFRRTGLGARLGRLIIRVMGTRSTMVIGGFLITGALLSMWVTAMAVAAMLMPLGVAILKECDIKPLQSNFGRALMIATAWGPLIGGIGTPAGAGPNIIAISFLSQMGGISISFLQWMSVGIPAVIMLVPAAWFILIKFFPPEIEHLPLDNDPAGKEPAPLTPRETVTLAIFLVTIGAWIATPLIEKISGGAVKLSMHAVALTGAVALFLPGVNALSWKEAEEDIDWGGIILICAGISLGMVIYDTGAARWLSWIILGPIMQFDGPLRIFLVIIAVALLHLAFSSNTVTGTIIIPLLIALAHDLGINPWLIAAPAAFSASQAYILVTETPTSVVPYSAGYFSMADMARAGIVMTIASGICITVSILVMGRITGLYAL